MANKLPQKVQQQKVSHPSPPPEKSRNSCCLFSAMVPLVFTIFIVYVSSYLGVMSGAFATDLKTENFSESDALKMGPPQFDLANKDYYNNLQAMSQHLSRPNQFMARGK